jgi:mannose-6-phosphate isomerase
MPHSDLRLEILGTSFRISVDEEASYLEELLAAYHDKVRDIQEATSLKDPLKIAILTGYSLCDELYKARHSAAAVEDEETLNRTLNFLSARLDQALEGGPFPDSRARTGPAGTGEAKAEGPAEAGEPALYRLTNPVRHYDWGSPHWIPRLLGVENPGEKPWAELWMGAHPAAPSAVRGISLGQLIAGDPPRYLGAEGAARYGGLPFLFKLLAAARPLSIQAHPGKEQARQGWQRENDRGIPPEAPERNYRDDNHKPEILCALSPFTALCGFRPPRDIASLFSAYLADAPRSLRSGLAPLWASLEEGAEGSPLRAFLTNLLGLSPELRAELTAYARSAPPRGPAGLDPDPWPLVRRLAEYYPGDPGILAPLYLNLLRLAPGQALYLPAGILHAYVEGFGVELMAASDNVLRGGLTSKHVDVDELTRVLYFHPFTPEPINPRPPAEGAEPAQGRPAPAEGSPARDLGTQNPGGAQDAEGAPGWYTYPSPSGEFALSVIRNLEGPFPVPGPAIIVVTGGRLRVSAGAPDGVPDSGPEPGEARRDAAPAPGIWDLGPGESAFIPPPAVPLNLSGTYTLYAASIPPASPQGGAEPG